MKRKRCKKYVHPITGKKHGEFTLCVECWGVYKTEMWEDFGWNCPHGMCAGTAGDAFPIIGRRYPMQKGS
jgi:hypothetical protein